MARRTSKTERTQVTKRDSHESFQDFVDSWPVSRLQALANRPGLTDKELVRRLLDAKEDLLAQYAELDSEIARLRVKVAEQARAVRERDQTQEQKEQRIQALESALDELNRKERLGFVANRIHVEAHNRLMHSTEFQRQFLETDECFAVVMAVDMRRSTDLMLKAKSPDAFASFATKLCSDLTSIVLDSYGVFDKFTGDGILCFYPAFYSGDDAAYRALMAAERCHERFAKHYAENRDRFTSVLSNVGLGIGIDAGMVRLVQMSGGLTVVGVPVVYACRFSNAPPGITLMNQPAFEAIRDRFAAYCYSSESTIDVKGEGMFLAYDVKPNGVPYAPTQPWWYKRD